VTVEKIRGRKNSRGCPSKKIVKVEKVVEVPVTRSEQYSPTYEIGELEKMQPRPLKLKDKQLKEYVEIEKIVEVPVSASKGR